jgi:hypothetical protein
MLHVDANKVGEREGADAKPGAPVRMRSMSAGEAMPSVKMRCASGTKALPT